MMRKWDPPAQEIDDLCRAIAEGATLIVAAYVVSNVSDRTVRRRCKHDPDLAARLRAAFAARTQARLSPCGTHGAFLRGCRCDECREARNARKRADNANRRARAADEAPHGTTTAYFNWQCRCDLCRRVGSIENARVAANRRARAAS